jgi:hypothetical protein
MTRAVTRTWYRIALVKPGGAPVLVAAQGEHLGAAVAAAEHHAPGAFAIAAEVAAGDGIPLGESVGKQHRQIIELAEPAGDLPPFHWPSGVLPRLDHAETFRGAGRGYVIRPDPGLFVIEAQTDADHVIDLFLGMVERLPAGDNLEVRVLDHFEDAGATDVWLTSRVNAKKILRFLDDFDVELIGNGHVELSVYVRAQHATLRLTEHKTVVWLAEDRALEVEVLGWLHALEVPPVPDDGELVTIAAAPHFHYRPAKSRDRKKLGEELYRQRLRRVDTVGAGRPASDTAG